MRFDPDKFKAFSTFRDAVEAQDAVSRHAAQAGVSHEDAKLINSRTAKAIASDDVRFEEEAAKLRAELDAWGV
jgi:hypothetical protein